MSRTHVLVPRAGRAPSTLALRLEDAGQPTLSIPSLRFEQTNLQELERALASLQPGDVVAFTSANGVRSVARLEGWQDRWAAAVMAATGPATAEVVTRLLGTPVAVVPDRFVAESFADALLAHGAARRRVWLPRAAEARDVLPEALRAAGADVRDVTAYAAVADEASRDAFAEVDWSSVALIAVASSRTLTMFDALLTTEARAVARAIPVASIGPITSATAVELGYTVAVEAPMSTMEALSDAMVAWLRPATC